MSQRRRRVSGGTSGRWAWGRSGRRGRGPVAAALTALLAVGALSACGTEAPDLFTVTRDGSVPGARLKLRVTDDGRASCNGRALVHLTSEQLITARESRRALDELPGTTLRLPAGQGSILRYAVRSHEASARWSDTSRGQPPVLFRLAKLTRDVAKGPCGLAR